MSTWRYEFTGMKKSSPPFLEKGLTARWDRNGHWTFAFRSISLAFISIQCIQYSRCFRHDTFTHHTGNSLKHPQSIAQFPGLQGQIHSHGGAGGHETDEDRGLGVEPRAIACHGHRPAVLSHAVPLSLPNGPTVSVPGGWHA